jgi:uncharacterized membrane protein YGL010W
MSHLERLLGEYAADHQHPFNQLMHRVCVPAIVVSVFGLLWSVPVPAAVHGASPYVNWATVVLVAVLAWYLRLSARLGAGMVLAGAAALLAVAGLARLPGPLWVASGGLFVVAWIGQFIGHAVEGKRPSFLRDLRFLLVGPLWLLAGLYRRIGLDY